jgi:hypothetical protein
VRWIRVRKLAHNRCRDRSQLELDDVGDGGKSGRGGDELWFSRRSKGRRRGLVVGQGVQLSAPGIVDSARWIGEVGVVRAVAEQRRWQQSGDRQWRGCCRASRAGPRGASEEGDRAAASVQCGDG